MLPLSNSRTNVAAHFQTPQRTAQVKDEQDVIMSSYESDLSALAPGLSDSQTDVFFDHPQDNPAHDPLSDEEYRSFYEDICHAVTGPMEGLKSSIGQLEMGGSWDDMSNLWMTCVVQMIVVLLRTKLGLDSVALERKKNKLDSGTALQLCKQALSEKSLKCFGHCT